MFVVEGEKGRVVFWYEMSTPHAANVTNISGFTLAWNFFHVGACLDRKQSIAALQFQFHDYASLTIPENLQLNC